MIGADAPRGAGSALTPRSRVFAVTLAQYGRG